MSSQKKKSKYAVKQRDRVLRADPFVVVPVPIPKKVLAKLETSAALYGYTVDRLILNAAINAKDGVGSFVINNRIPDNADEYINYFKEEEKLLLLWIAKTGYRGVGLDTLVICRDDIGIPEKTILLYAFNSLLKMGQIEYSNLRYRITSVEKVSRAKQFKKFEGESTTELCNTTNNVSEKKTGISSL